MVDNAVGALCSVLSILMPFATSFKHAFWPVWPYSPMMTSLQLYCDDSEKERVWINLLSPTCPSTASFSIKMLKMRMSKITPTLRPQSQSQSRLPLWLRLAPKHNPFVILCHCLACTVHAIREAKQRASSLSQILSFH